jgi:hypothetical protein
MRAILAIATIVVVAGCDGSRQFQRPIVSKDDVALFPRRGESQRPVVRNDPLCESPARRDSEPQEPAAEKQEIYNSPTLWQSFKSIHMAHNAKPRAARKKDTTGQRDLRPK